MLRVHIFYDLVLTFMLWLCEVIILEIVKNLPMIAVSPFVLLLHKILYADLKETILLQTSQTVVAFNERGLKNVFF